MKIKEIARDMVRRNGLINLTRAELSAAAGIADGSFPHHAGCSFNDLVRELQEDIELMEQQPPATQQVDRNRVNPTLRKKQILGAAITVAKKQGYDKISRADIANAAGVSEPLISHYFGTMADIRIAIMTEAVRIGVVEIVAQGLGNCDPLARTASDEVKQAAVDSMMG